eukprot:SAG11_NODE_1538_length_4723_cov_5.640138_3_plen_68_part_00
MSSGEQDSAHVSKPAMRYPHGDDIVRQIVSKCEELTFDECKQFLDHGFVLVRNAFDRNIAKQVVEQA